MCADGSELYAPTVAPDDVAEGCDAHHEDEEVVADSVADDCHHGMEVDLVEHPEDEEDGAGEGEEIACGDG